MELDNDDLPVGRVLTRREVPALFGTVGAAVLVGCSVSGSDSTVSSITPSSTSGSSNSTETAAQAVSTATTPTEQAAGKTTESAATEPEKAASEAATPEAGATLATLPACVVSPALTEGPYFVDEGLNRSDIRSDPATGAVSDGALLQLVLSVVQVNGDGCVPLAGAVVDIWHCDAAGVYSDVSDPGFSTLGQQFLRGYQVTDGSGVVRFTTIYPGWYQGRAVHIHFKIRCDAPSGGSYEFTSQFFVDEAMTDQVHATEPYASKGYRTLLNAGDGIFQDGGDLLILSVSETDDGYLGTFDIGVQLA